MDKYKLHEGLKGRLPDVNVGSIGDDIYVVSATHGTKRLESVTRSIHPGFQGDFLYSPLGVSPQLRRMEWVDSK